MYFVSVSAPHRSFYRRATIMQYHDDVKKIEKYRVNDKRFVSLTRDEITDYIHKKTILESSLNPDTEELISWPQRISAFIPTNLPIFSGMLLTSPTTRNIIIWQGINQSYNAGLNFGNRNASSSQTN